jgi:phospholipase/carboxylesterase
VGFPDPATFWSTFEVLGRWLDALPTAFGVPWERAVLGGFSQGSVMAYALGLGEGRTAPGAVLALSGFIPTVEGFEIALAGRQGYPVAIGHGTLDAVIPVEFGRAARERLEQAGLDVLYRESPMAHTIDPTFIGELKPWVRGVVGAGDRPGGPDRS